MPKSKAEEAQEVVESTPVLVKVRVLTQCAYGNPDDVVELPEADAKQATADGIADANPDAVAYAESLVG